MGHVTIVYGIICGPIRTTRDDYHILQRHNKKILDALAQEDNSFPWIERSMFNCPDPAHDKIYSDQVITFGASYKAVEYEWDQWLLKFESVLKTLYWTNVIIHLDTELVGSHKYEWNVNPGQMENWFKEIPETISEWEFSGGPRKF